MLTSLRVTLVATAFVIASGFAKTPTRPSDVTVHEWGTFTSVAGEDGRAVPWLPLDGPTDLPCFVARAGVSTKATLAATVRMETPVLYFYASRETIVDVRVGFRQGFITEHFPRATVKPADIYVTNLLEPAFASRIAWQNVRILPDSTPMFRTESKPNHYYAARATDAAPIEVGADRERFLFYRGVAGFPLPIAATIGLGDNIIVNSLGDGLIPAMMLFENRGGRVGYRLSGRPGGQIRLPRPDLEGDLDATRAALRQMLVDQGLYPREASAMVETWRDSWFTEGTRLLYVVPQSTVDAVLPLRIDPAPVRIARVFVGRLKLATEATLSDIGAAVRTNDQTRLQQYGRFLQPFVERLLARTTSAEDRSRLQTLLARSTPVLDTSASACR